jgi:hypothetical protein
LNKKHPMLMKILSDLDDEKQKELKTYLSLVESYAPTMLSGVLDIAAPTDISDEDRRKEIINIKEKIRIFRVLQYDDAEIYEALYDSPEYLYIKEELKNIIEETV